MSAIWRDIIATNVANVQYDARGVLTFVAKDFVSFLLSCGRVTGRGAGVDLGETLRARDVIRPVSSESRFLDNGTRWLCRADEPASPSTSFSVAALMNSSNYVLAAPFLKQGTVFLNPRFFVLDRSTCRLYVFTADYSLSPRYYVDFARQRCTITLLTPAGGTDPNAATDGDTSDSDTDDDEGVGPAARGHGGAASWQPAGTGSPSLPAGRGKAWGFSIVSTSSRIYAYCASETRARVWVRAMAAAASLRPPRPILSHSQQRLRAAAIAPPPPTVLARTPSGAATGDILFASSGTPASLPRHASGTDAASRHGYGGGYMTSPGRGGSGNGSGMAGDGGLQSSAGSSGAGQATAPILSLSAPIATVRQLLSVHHDALRTLLPPSWAKEYAVARAQAAGLPADQLLMDDAPWATVEEAALQQLSVGVAAASASGGGSPSLVELYASSLDLYAKAMSDALGLHAVGGSGGNASDLRPLRMLVLEPQRMLADCGIFIPAHQRYVLERCAALVPPLPIEQEAAAAAAEAEADDAAAVAAASIAAGLSHDSYGAATVSTAESIPEDAAGENEDGAGGGLPAVPPAATVAASAVEAWGTAAEAAAEQQRAPVRRQPSRTSLAFQPTALTRSSSRLMLAHGRGSSAALADASGGVGAALPSPSVLSPHPHSSSNASALGGEYGFVSRPTTRTSMYGGASGNTAPVSSSSMYHGGGGGGSASGRQLQPLSQTQRGSMRIDAAVLAEAADAQSLFHSHRALVHLQIAAAFSSFAAAAARQEAEAAAVDEAALAASLLPTAPATVGDGQRALYTRSRNNSAEQSQSQLAGKDGSATSGAPDAATAAATVAAAMAAASAAARSAMPAAAAAAAVAPTTALNASLDPLSCEAWAMELARTASTVHSVFKTKKEPATPAPVPASARSPPPPAPSPRSPAPGARPTRKSTATGGTLAALERESSSLSLDRRGSGGSVDLDRALAVWAHRTGRQARRASSADKYVYGNLASMDRERDGDRRESGDSGSSRGRSRERVTSVHAAPSAHATSAAAAHAHTHATHGHDHRSRAHSAGEADEQHGTGSGTHAATAAQHGSTEPLTTVYRMWNGSSHNHSGDEHITSSTRAADASAAASSSASSSSAAGGGSGGGGSHAHNVISKVMELTTARLKAMMTQYAVQQLETGTHPAALLLQRVVSALQSLYGQSTFPHFGIDANEAAGFLKADLAPCMVHIARQLRDWPRTWLAALTDFAATGLYMRPSGTFERSMRSYIEGSGNSSGAAGISPQELQAAWRYVCRIARSVTLSDRDAEEVAEDAVQNLVFRVLGPSLTAVYRAVEANAATDAALRQAYSFLWGLTTTQLDLGTEFRMDAVLQFPPAKHVMALPSVPGSGSSFAASSSSVLSLGQQLQLPSLPLSTLYVSVGIPLRLHLPLVHPRVLGLSNTGGSGSGAGGGGAKASGIASGGVRSSSSGLLSGSHNNNEEEEEDTALPELPQPPPRSPATAGIGTPPSGKKRRAHVRPVPSFDELATSSSGSGAAFSSPAFLQQAPVPPHTLHAGLSRSHSVYVTSGAGMRAVPEQEDSGDSTAAAAAATTGSAGSAGAAAASASGKPGKLAVQYKQFAWPAYADGSSDMPAALSHVQPAIDIFSLISSYPEPNMKLRVVMAALEAICRCETLHRQALLAGLAQMKASGDSSAAAVASGVDTKTLADPAHLNADDLVGLFSYVAVHAQVPYLASEIAIISDFVSGEHLKERPGFVLTTVEAAVGYCTGEDIRKRVKCGHCEGASGQPVAVRCRACGRQLCAHCDALLHPLPMNAAYMPVGRKSVGSSNSGSGSGSSSGSTEAPLPPFCTSFNAQQAAALATHIRVPAPIALLAPVRPASVRMGAGGGAGGSAAPAARAAAAAAATAAQEYNRGRSTSMPHWPVPSSVPDLLERWAGASINLNDASLLWPQQRRAQ